MAPDIGSINGAKDQPKAIVNEQPLHTPRRLRVVGVGAGFSGLTLAYKYKYKTNMSDYVDLTIYDKNADVGGTWYENRYPGVACDVPAHVYTFNFEPNPNWSQFYSSGPEIWEYIRRTTTKYGLDERVQFNRKIVETIWDDDKGKWNIKVKKTDSDEVFDDEADVLVNTTGFLNKWRWPDIDGLHDFKGTLLHSAAWNDDIDWVGKRVALIGNGSSAIQILPQVQKGAKHVTTFIRTPTWISSNFAAEFTKNGGNFNYTEEEKAEFRKDPEKLKEYRHKIEHAMNGYFFGFFKDSPVQAYLQQLFRKSMEDRLHDPELREKLIPDFHVGCRRLTPGDGYLEALQEPNVRIEFDPIERFTAEGIKTKSQEHPEEFDMIVCATGFDASFSPFWKLAGKDGITLAEQWQDKPEAYFGVAAPHIPNYFMFTGPNSPLGHGTITACFEASSDFALRWIRRIAETGIKSVTVKQDAVREYNDYTQEFLKRMVWTSGCRSWYKDATVDGPVTAMYGGSVLHFKEVLDSFRVEDFDIEYFSGNRFRFMGNGLTARDVEGKDLAPYLYC